MFSAITDHSLRLVTDSGTALVVTAPGDIGLSSSTAQIAHAEAKEPEDGEGPEPRPGPTPTPTPPSPSARDVQVGLSLQASLRDPEKREAIYKMLQALSRAVDDDQVSHIQVSARATLPESASTEIISRADEAGANPNSTPI
jgi:hypothetical protein